MANTAIKTEEEKKEYFDTPEELNKKIDILVQLVKESKHFIAFTGAGISTSTGIPDFRSGVNTVLQTGPGCWEKLATNFQPKKSYKRVDMLQAIPSKTHMAFVKLMNENILKFVISQNVDGLHRRSGIPADKIAELHGNANLEYCKACGKEYLRDFDTMDGNHADVHDHRTRRICEDPKCQQVLYDSIINFGENLPEKALLDGFNHSAKSDLCLSMGSSLRVTPAAHMPLKTAEKGGKLIIVNLQKTPLDKYAFLIIHALCDDVMTLLMKKLAYEIPSFYLTRYIKVIVEDNISDPSSKKLKVIGQDSIGNPYTLFPQIEVIEKNNVLILNKEPFSFVLKKETEEIKLEFHFLGHYDEPDLVMLVNTRKPQSKTFMIKYQPYSKSSEKKVWQSITEI